MVYDQHELTASPLCPWDTDTAYSSGPSPSLSHVFTGVGGISSDDLRTMCQNLHHQVAALLAMIESDRICRDREQQAVHLRLDDVVLLLNRFKPPEAVPKEHVWVCPVCLEPSAHMRSFKGHIKRLYDWESRNRELDGDPRPKHRCMLTDTTQRHRNLVARSGQHGDPFSLRSKAFATYLWNHVQNLTSSDDCPGNLAALTAMSDGTAP
jgi:hypothetical protein